jgi:hypothetical protein
LENGFYSTAAQIGIQFDEFGHIFMRNIKNRFINVAETQEEAYCICINK